MLARLARPLALAVLATGVVLASTAIMPATPPARSATTVDPGEAAIELVAAPSAAGIVRPAEPVSVRVTITNTGSVPTGRISVALQVAGTQAVNTEQLADWFASDRGETSSDRDTASVAEKAVAEATVSPLESGASAVFDLVVAADSPALGGEFGARLASVRATIDGETLAVDHTALVWTPGNAATPVTATTFIAPIATPGEPSAFLSSNDLAGYTEEAGALTRTLDAVAGRPVLIAIDPRIVGSIRLLGEQAPATATAFLERLGRAPNESFLLPWADADPVATLTAANTALPTPEGSGVAQSDDDAGGTGQPTESPRPTPLPEQAVTLAQLSDWPTTFEDWNWVGPASLTTDATAALSEQGSTVLIVPGSSLDEGAPVQNIDAVRILRADDAIAQAAQDASLARSQQQFDRSFARLSALLAASAQAGSGIPTMITLSRDQLASTDRLIDTIAQTVSLPWVDGAEASVALKADSVAAAIVAPEGDAGRVTAVRAALEAEAADRVFAGIAVAPEAITDIRRLELLGALSLGWGANSGDALRVFVADSTILRSSVQVVESSDIFLPADRASLPVTVRNQLDVAVRVFVHVDPDTVQLRVVDGSVETLVEPLSQTRALVPVESLTNGRVDITVSVRDKQSRVVGEPTRVSLNLQAGWETAAIIAIGLAVVLLLTFGIARDIRRRRQRTAKA